MSTGAARAACTLFPTAIGTCGIAWRDGKIIASQLPEANEALARARLLRRAAGAQEAAPPTIVRQAIGAMTALLDGARIDLAFIDCDLAGIDPFRQQVYAHTRLIPPGETLSYGEIAMRLGNRMLAQNVGQALGKNPFPIIVPCHRVMGAKGRLTGFSANGGIETKLRMLAIEGARMGETPALFGELPLAVKPARG